MAIVQTFESELRGGVQEYRFSYASVGTGNGIEILFQFPVYIHQLVASWSTSVTMTLQVVLPSGTLYVVKDFTSVQSIVLNSLSSAFVYWMELPAGTRVQLNVSGAITNLNLSIVARPI